MCRCFLGGFSRGCGLSRASSLAAFAFGLWGCCVGLCACGSQERKADNAAFATDSARMEQGSYDAILASGELIVVTMSGPDTYYEYQGKAMGLQYAMAEDFASKEGLRLRVELVRDTTALIKLVKEGGADVACLMLPQDEVEAEGLWAAGARNDSLHTAWAIRSGAEDLAGVLDDWFAQGVEIQVSAAENKRFRERRNVQRKVRAPYISKEQGIISIYDSHFKMAARATGWDWKLIAAQCYQESGFDPNALSWAGARGLMQIMPATAEHLGLAKDRMYEPADNIAAATKYIRELSAMFNGVGDAEERIKFVLAAYNGGPGHVLDAMALARKYGKQPHLWADVGFFVHHLSEPRYYRDPVVKHGYMIGEETYNYVASVMERWRAYGGNVNRMPLHAAENVNPNLPSDHNDPAGNGRTARKKNKYTKDTKIYTPDDPEFFEM